MQGMGETTLNEGGGSADQAVAQAQVRYVMGCVAAVGVVGALGATMGWGWRAGVGVLVGSLLAVANLWSLKRIGAGFFSEHARQRRVWGLLGGLKFLVLAAIVVGLLALHLVQPLAFVIGYGALPVGITIGTFLGPRMTEESVH
jgi:hypothetical protein